MLQANKALKYLLLKHMADYYTYVQYLHTTRKEKSKNHNTNHVRLLFFFTLKELMKLNETPVHQEKPVRNIKLALLIVLKLCSDQLRSFENMNITFDKRGHLGLPLIHSKAIKKWGGII